jgi:DNA-binding transcriptional regulator YdaS (Cro superfamily)
MATANHIIDLLGGTSAVANALGVTPSVVHSWRKSNSIPRWRHAVILELALRTQKTLSSADFPISAARKQQAA